MAFLAFYRGMRPLQRKPRFGVIEFYLIDICPSPGIVATFAILPQSIRMNILVAIQASFELQPGKFDKGPAARRYAVNHGFMAIPAFYLRMSAGQRKFGPGMIEGCGRLPSGHRVTRNAI
jgi:hypothetical protein